MAARHGDLEATECALATSGVDVNEVCLLEPVGPLRAHEAPLYASHALFEACRARSEPVISRLLREATLDVNAPCTSVGVTAFADACARGDAAIAALLLADARVDATAGCTYAAHPALIAAMVGSVDLLRVLAARGVLDASLEEDLLRTAAANGRSEVRGRVCCGRARERRAVASTRLRGCVAASLIILNAASPFHASRPPPRAGARLHPQPFR